MASELLAPSSADSLSGLSSRFEGLASRIRRVALLKGLGRVAVITGALCAVGLLGDWLWPLPPWARMSWLALVVGAMGYALWREVFRPVFQRFTVAELAAIVESHYPELGERLTSAVELTDPRIPEDHKGSALMREWLEAETVSSTEHLDFRKAVSADRAQKSAWAAGCAVVVLLIPCFVMASGYGQLWARLLMPWGSHELPGVLYFQVPDGDRVVARGEDLTLLALPPEDVAIEDLPAGVELVWTTPAGESDRRPMEYAARQKGYVVTLPHVFEGFEYLVTAPRKRSDRHAITVVDRPEITGFTLTITPPGYTGLEEHKIDGAVGNVVAFERSRIKAELEFNKPLAEARWLWRDAEAAASSRPLAVPFQLSEDKKSATLELLASQGWFSARVIDEHGLANSDETARNLMILADQPPEIELSGQIDTTQARRDDVITLEAFAQDDLAISALELHIETATGQTEITPVPADELGGREVRHTFTLDLAALDLADGEWLKYRVRAADNRPVPGPNEVWSEERRIIIDPEADLPGSEELTKKQNELRDILEAIRTDLRKNLKGTENIRAEAETQVSKNQPLEKQAELTNLENQERELSERLEELAGRFGQHRLFSNLTPETRRIAREPLNKAAEQLQKVQQENNVAQQAEALAKSAEALIAADRDLEKLAKRFDDLAALEQDLLVMPRLAQQAQRVADEALALAKRRDNPPAGESPDEKAAREAELDREEFQLDQERQSLTDALDELLKQRPEVLEAARKTALEQIAELSQQAGHLADRQDALTENLKADALEAAKAAGPVADRQADLVKRAEQFHPPAKEDQQVKPLDREELRKVLEELKAGNLAAAGQQQQALADRLEALAAELKQNQKLPADPQQAAARLADRQRDLQKQIEAAAKSQPAEIASAAEKQAFENALRKLAERQTGIQAGIAQMQPPAPHRDEQKQALDQAAAAVQNLIESHPEQAANAAKQAAETLEKLAKNIGTPEERLAKAKQDLQKTEEAREQLEELIKKQQQRKKPAANNPEAKPDPQAEEELQRLKQENALAQKQAAEALKKLRQDLAKQETQEKLHDETNEAKQQAERLAKENPPPQQPELPQAEDVEQLAQEARAVQEEIQELQKERAAKSPEQTAKAESAPQPEGNPPANIQEPNPERPKDSDANNPDPNNPPVNASDPKNPPANAADPNNSQPNASDANASRLNQSPAPSPKNGSQPNPQRAEQSPKPGETMEQNLAEKQAELARQSAELAIKVAQDQGKESPASQKAIEAARKSSQAREQAEDGALDQAAKTANNAADAANAAAEELAKEEAAELSQEAARQAAAQTKLAQELAKASADTAKRQAALQAGQQGLEVSSKKLAADLAEAARKLGSKPLDLEQPGEKTQAAGQAAAEASGEMRQAKASAAKGNSAQAAEAGQKASEALRRAAGESPAPPANTPENTLVPGDLAEQVADARRRLEEARKQLQNAQKPPQTPQTAEAGNDPPAPMPEPSTTEPGNSDPSMPGQNADGQNPNPGKTSPTMPPGQGQPENGQPGQGQPRQPQSAQARSAQSLQQAAQSLSQAAQQLEAGIPGKNQSAGQSSRSAISQGQPSSSGSEGPGSQSAIPLEQLEAVLRQQNSEEWGQLSGQLKTEILQGNKQKPEGDYARLIKLYSEELLKKQQTQPPKK